MNEPAEQAVVAPGPAGRLPWWWNKTGAVVVVSVLVALVGFAVWTWGKDRCLWSPDVPFRALVNDPLADKELLGLELGHSREKRGSTPNNLIALNPMCGSVVDRSFTPGPEGAAEDGRRIVKFAEQNGWVVTNVSDQRGRFSVRLSKPHGEDKLSGQVTGDDDPSSGAPQVHVHLLG